VEGEGTEPSEAQRVHDWRLSVLLGLGLTPRMADRLAASDIDIRYAEHLVVDLSYSPAQAFTLLRP
jgi:hypothetical protein